MSKYGANLPAVLNPVGDTCVQVYIPNHPDYIKLFVRAVRMLEVNRMYARDETMEGAKIVTAQWRDRTITPLIEALASSTGSCGVDGECLAYPPFASFISYSPQNPYTEPDLIPEGFEQPPFYVNGKDPAHDLPNYQKGDVILDFGSINIEPSWDLAKTPRIELCLEGSGVCEIHFLNIAQGGAAIVSLDNPVDLGDIIAGIIGDGIDSIDLNQDIVSLPPETAAEIIIEVEVPTEGEHVIYIYFLPVVNDSLIPLSFGGGLREISLCGNLRPCGTEPPPPPPPLDGVTELKPQFQFTADCGLEYRLLNQEDEIVQDWTAVEGWTENAALCFAVGSGMATKDDIRDGIYEAVNRLSLQLASGGYTNIAVDSEGNVSSGDSAAGGGDAGLPEDDPATQIDETESARYGAMIEIAAKLEAVLDKIDTLFGVDATADTPEQDAQDIMKAYFPCDETLMAAAVTSYYGWRIVPNNQFAFNGSTTFPQYLYCNGYDENTLNRYLLDVAAYTINKTSRIGQFWDALSDDFFSQYYAKGQVKPSNAYLDAACVPIAEQTLLNMAFGVARATTIVKSAHRMKFVWDNWATDAAGNLQDAFWYVTAAGVRTRSNPTVVHSAGANMPSDNQVPYNTAHHYEYTIDLAALANNPITITPNKNGGLNVTHTWNTGTGFKLVLSDLGLAISQ